MIPVVIHLPNASETVPDECLSDLRVGHEQLQRLLAESTEHHCGKIFGGSATGVAIVSFPVSRLVCDPARLETEAESEMVEQDARGDRTAPTPVQGSVSRERQEWYAARFLRPHQAELREAAELAASVAGHVLLIEGRTPSKGPSAGKRLRLVRLGISTPDWLLAAATEFARESGWRSEVIRRPRSASLPAQLFAKDRRVILVGIEVLMSDGMRLGVGEADAASIQKFVDGLVCSMRAAATAECALLVDLERYIAADGRVCPMPEDWAQLGEVVRARPDEGYPPSLILGGWHTPAIFKTFRLQAQVQWAFRKGRLHAADAYLRGLPADRWYRLGD